MTPEPSPDSAVDVLVTLCRRAAQRPAVETTDSWLHNYGRDESQVTLARLRRDPIIDEHLEAGRSVYLAGANWGMGMTPFDHWLRGFLRAALAQEPATWQHEAERFIGFLAVDGGTVPCRVRTTPLGVLLVGDDSIELPGARIRSARRDDFFTINAHDPVPPAAVFEYEIDIPAAISSAPHHAPRAGGQRTDDARHRSNRR